MLLYLDQDGSSIADVFDVIILGVRQCAQQPSDSKRMTVHLHYLYRRRDLISPRNATIPYWSTPSSMDSTLPQNQENTILTILPHAMPSPVFAFIQRPNSAALGTSKRPTVIKLYRNLPMVHN